MIVSAICADSIYLYGFLIPYTFQFCLKSYKNLPLILILYIIIWFTSFSSWVRSASIYFIVRSYVTTNVRYIDYVIYCIYELFLDPYQITASKLEPGLSMNTLTHPVDHVCWAHLRVLLKIYELTDHINKNPEYSKGKFGK